MFIKNKIKYHYKGLWSFFHNLRVGYYEFLGHFFPRKLIEVWYRHVYKEPINLTSPENINEKINWLKLNTDTSVWSRCTDKYEVRVYVQLNGLGHTLNEVYGVFNNEKEIDFDSLPDSFVIKTTNGGGGKNVMIVRDKKQLDVSEAKKTLRKWLKYKVGYRYYEPQYFSIVPRLIVEKYLNPSLGEESLVDYKIFCFNGQPYSILCCSDRAKDRKTQKMLYDLEWNPLPEGMVEEYRDGMLHPKPQSLGQMLEYSKKLSRGFPFVRMDWYDIDGEPIFSEMTFTPSGGFQHAFTIEYLKELGDQLTINTKTSGNEMF